MTISTIPYGYCQCGCGQKTRIAHRTDRGRNLFKGEPVRFVSGHNMQANLPADLVDPNPSGLCQCGCGGIAPKWTRSSAIHRRVKGHHKRFISGHNGYKHTPRYLIIDLGHDTPCWMWLWAKDREGYGQFRKQRAHRYYYEQARGPIPPGLQIDHLCRNPPCVNPDHLEPVTPAENSRRGKCAKFTPGDVRLIRRLYAEGTYNQTKLAELYQVRTGTISSLVRRESYANID